MQGIVTGLRKVLNVEDCDVMEIEDASDSLALNVALMRKQFALDEF